MGKRVLEAVITAALVAFISFISSLTFTYFFDNNSSVKIGMSTELSKRQFVLPIDINTFEKDIKDLRIGLPLPVNEQQIKSNQPLNIKIIKNNIGETTGTILEVTKIPSGENVQLVLKTNKSVEGKNVQVYENGNKVDIEYLSKTKNPLQSQLKVLVLSSIIYAILAGITTYLGNKRLNVQTQKLRDDMNDLEKTRVKHNQEAKETMGELKKHLEESKIKQDDLKNEIKETREAIARTKTESLKKQILLQAKLNDYRKELNFWRDTIRKILYRLPHGEKKAEELFKIISSSLKTYQTHEKDNHDFETLKVLSKMISDIDKE